MGHEGGADGEAAEREAIRGHDINMSYSSRKNYLLALRSLGDWLGAWG